MNGNAHDATLDMFGAFKRDAEAALAAGAMTLEQFAALQREWSQSAFGPSPPRGPMGPLKHLAKEVTEALEVVMMLDRLRTAPVQSAVTAQLVADEREHLLTELVDCYFLVCDAVWRAGFGQTELRQALGKKLQTNRRRVWPKMAPDQVVEHDRSGESP